MTLQAGAPPVAEDVLAAVLAATAIKAAKTSNTTRNNTTTLAADPALSVPVLANKIYRLEGFLIYTSGTVPDFKIDITLPSGATVEANVTTFNAAGTPGALGVRQDMLSTGVAIGVPGNGTTYSTQRQQMHILGEVDTAGTPGNCVIRWAQNTLEASNTILYAGSWLRLEEMG